MTYCTLAVVDDDLTARTMIKSLLKETAYQVAAEFATPKEAYEWLCTHDVSMLLCDMKLPQMNGVELIEMVRTIHPDMPVVAISSFEDFEFARGCIRNQVCDYLLKSNLTQARLLSVLDKVRQQYHLQGEETPEVSPIVFSANDPFTLQRLHGLIATNKLSLEEEMTLPVELCLDFPIKSGINWKAYRHDNCATFVDIITDVLGAIPHVIHVASDESVLVILSFSRDTRDPAIIQKTWQRFVQRTRRTCFRLLDLTITAIAGTPGTLEETMAELPSFHALEAEVFHQTSGATIQLPATGTPSPRSPFMANGYLDVLTFALTWWDGPLAHDLLERMFLQWGKSGCGKAEIGMVADRMLSLLEVPDRGECITQITRLSALKDLALRSCDEQIVTRSDAARKAYPLPVFSLMESVKQQYRQNLSLQAYADSLGCSYTYLSREFKDKTGLRFVEFSNLIKVNRSKLWLLDGSVPLKQIYQQVGFESSSYFFKVFKDVEKVTPSEYITKNCSLS